MTSRHCNAAFTSRKRLKLFISSFCVSVSVGLISLGVEKLKPLSDHRGTLKHSTDAGNEAAARGKKVIKKFSTTENQSFLNDGVLVSFCLSEYYNGVFCDSVHLYRSDLRHGGSLLEPEMSPSI